MQHLFDLKGHVLVGMLSMVYGGCFCFNSITSRVENYYRLCQISLTQLDLNTTRQYVCLVINQIKFNYVASLF